MKPEVFSISNTLGSRHFFTVLLSLCVLCFVHQGQAQVPQVLDIRNPNPGVTRIIPDWGPGSVRPPQVIGDVDGDRFDDFAIVQADPTGQAPPPYTVIIYGSPNFPLAARMGDLRQTKLLHGDGFTGISAWDSSHPCAPAGDVDRDGYGDFYFGSASTDGGECQTRD